MILSAHAPQCLGPGGESSYASSQPLEVHHVVLSKVNPEGLVFYHLSSDQLPGYLISGPIENALMIWTQND